MANRNRILEFIFLSGSVALITVLHYTTPLHREPIHELLRRAYYLPILYAAARLGWRGGLWVAGVSSLLYLPHMFHYIHMYASQSINNYVDMLVFLALGGGVGYLVDKYRHADRLAAVGGTTARIVHDMKNPIASIQAASDLLREDLPKEQREEFVDIISESVQRFLNMTGELLEFSRGGAQRLNYSLSNMEAFLEETAKTLRPLFQQRDLQLVVRVEGAIEAELDSERIRRVVNNIAQNALEVLPPGGGLKIECSAVNDKILLKFVDDGPGMPPHVKSRILEAFFSYGKAGGTGLGLAIAKDIIAQHDGSIRVESAVGKGTTFFVALPRTPRRSPTASRKNTKPTSQTESTEKPLLLA